MSVTNVMSVHPIVVKYCAQNYRNEPDGGARGKTRRHPLGTTNVRTSLYSSPSLMSLGFNLWGTQTSVTNFMAIHQLLRHFSLDQRVKVDSQNNNTIPRVCV